MIAEFLSWWAAQMAGLATPVLKRFQAGEPDALIIEAGDTDDGTLTLARRRKGRIEPLPPLPGDEAPDAMRATLARAGGRLRLVVAVPVPPLIREVTLPAAAASRLDRFLGFEMDRLTPFPAEAVLFTYRILGHDRRTATIRVAIVLVPRQWVQPVLDRLAEAAIPLSAVEARTADGEAHLLPVLHEKTEHHARQRLVWRGALAMCGALALAVILVPLLRQSLALAEVADRVQAIRPQVEQVEKLRQRIASGSAGAGRVAAARQQAGVPLLVLGVLTDDLPDDTWLSALTLRQNRLVIEGHSSAAIRLIAVLASEPRFRNPAFGAPVLRAENGGDIFTIQAEVAP